MVEPEMLLALWMSEMDVLYFLESALRVSPFLTVWRIGGLDLGVIFLGDGLRTTFLGVGLGVYLGLGAV